MSDASSSHTKTSLYSVYVIELDDSKRRDTAREALYVGSTYHEPEHRYQQHLAGYKASRHVRGHGIRLRPDLFEQCNPLPTRAAAQEKEHWLANRLREQGFTVYSA